MTICTMYVKRDALIQTKYKPTIQTIKNMSCFCIEHAPESSSNVGSPVGSSVTGSIVGIFVGITLGFTVKLVGISDGVCVGNFDGATDGFSVGIGDGSIVGTNVCAAITIKQSLLSHQYLSTT